MRTQNATPTGLNWATGDERELGWMRCECCGALIPKTELENSTREISSCIVCGHQNQKTFRSASTGT
jgi:hypothetical protein